MTELRFICGAIAFSAFGFIIAEAVHRWNVRKMYETQNRNALIAEYIDKQLWQFVSLDEWLEGMKEGV